MKQLICIRPANSNQPIGIQRRPFHSLAVWLSPNERRILSWRLKFKSTPSVAWNLRKCSRETSLARDGSSSGVRVCSCVRDTFNPVIRCHQKPTTPGSSPTHTHGDTSIFFCLFLGLTLLATIFGNKQTPKPLRHLPYHHHYDLSKTISS